MHAGFCVYLCCCLFAGLACVSFIYSCAFLGKNILDFDVGNSDDGDGGSQGRVIPKGAVVRGEEAGKEGVRPLLMLSVVQFSVFSDMIKYLFLLLFLCASSSFVGPPAVSFHLWLLVSISLKLSMLSLGPVSSFSISLLNY